jgi:hypothetical protein
MLEKFDSISHTPERNKERKEKLIEIRYELKEIPKWYIQGSFVLDKIFNKNFARDIDIFVPENEKIPELEEKIHKVELPEKSFFSPPLRCYNTDCYLLTAQGIIKPVNFPEKPKSLELLGEHVLTVEDVRGIKISKRYQLVVSETVKKSWQKTLKSVFDPEWMETMSFKSEQEVIDFIVEILKEETSKEERESVVQELSKLIGRKIILK